MSFLSIFISYSNISSRVLPYIESLKTINNIFLPCDNNLFHQELPYVPFSFNGKSLDIIYFLFITVFDIFDSNILFP